MRRAALYLVVLAAVGFVCWRVPPFRVVPLEQAQDARAEAAFNAVDYANVFWRERLMPNLGQAADASTVLEALARDTGAAAREFGRTVGASDTAYFFIAGQGTVVTVSERSIGVSLQGADSPADLLLKTGLIFGNTARDATGLLDVNEFANSQDFNAISEELNRLVEARVIPGLKAGSKMGVQLDFTAALEVETDSEVSRPLKAIPLLARIETP